MRCFRSAPLLAVVLVLLTASAAPAQTAGGADLGGSVSGSFGDGGPGTAVGFSTGYRFSPWLGIEASASYQPRLDFGQIPLCPPGRFCILANTALFRGGAYALRGRTRSASIAIVSELPVSLWRVRPYLAAGGGLANVRRELRDTELSFTFSRTSTDPMLTIGGGLELPFGRHVALSVDLRYERVFGDDQFDRPDVDTDLSLVKVGTGVRYRF